MRHLKAMPKYFLIALGFLFVGLACLGVVLPILPTTPFLLLAAACFAKSSERFYQWLLNIRFFGTLIENWRETRSIPRNTKLLAIATIIVVGGSSVLFLIEAMSTKAIIMIVLLFHIIFIMRIRNTEAVEPDCINGSDWSAKGTDP